MYILTMKTNFWQFLAPQLSKFKFLAPLYLFPNYYLTQCDNAAITVSMNSFFLNVIVHENSNISKISTCFEK